MSVMHYLQAHRYPNSGVGALCDVEIEKPLTDNPFGVTCADCRDIIITEGGGNIA